MCRALLAGVSQHHGQVSSSCGSPTAPNTSSNEPHSSCLSVCPTPAVMSPGSCATKWHVSVSPMLRTTSGDMSHEEAFPLAASRGLPPPQGWLDGTTSPSLSFGFIPHPPAHGLAPPGKLFFFFFKPSSSSAARHSGATAFAFKCLASVYSYLRCLFLLSQQCKSRLIPLKFMELRQCKTD